MLYKLAAKKRKVNRKKIRQEALARANLHNAGAVLLGPLGTIGTGLYSGIKAKHPVVGTFFGPIGVNGAIAKKTGVSTLGASAANSALWGAGLGAIRGAQLGGAQGALVGTAGGALGGGIGGAGMYGLGYLFGN